MILFPAIDVYGGTVVRLTQGDYGRKTEYSVTVREMAEKYKNAGCDHIHIVDLEGAKAGHPCNLDALKIASDLDMFVQYGGGLRSADAIAEALNAGADRVMVGSLLFKSGDAPKKVFERFGTAVMPSIDLKGGKVVYGGWLEKTEKSALEAITELCGIGYKTFLVTDTERDGQMQGSRTEIYRPLIAEGREIVAAGGVTTADDLRKLAALGVGAAVIGKSFYEGGITIKAALCAAKGGN